MEKKIDDILVEGWFASDNEEIYQIGPCDSKEQVIEEAKSNEEGMVQDDDGKWKLAFTVIRAEKRGLKISKFIDADEILDRFAECSSEDYGHPDGDWNPLENVTRGMKNDLTQMMQATVDQWQQKHGILIDPWIFTKVHESEDVVLDLEEEDAA